MSSIKVSTIKEVLEQFRLDIVAQLQAGRFKVPAAAKIPGNCDHALRAWVRLQHRGVPQTRRTVYESIELQQRSLDANVRASLLAIRSEFERGDDVTHRLTRDFYRAGFNDFLFNTFGIQHLHLGAPGAGRDKTRQHQMSGADSALLFAVVEQQEVYFVDVLDHEVFDRPELAKALVQTGLRNWSKLLSRYAIAGMQSADLSFEEAFRGAKAGFTTVFQVDGFFFARGTVRDGKVVNGFRTSCTSTEVVIAADRILNLVAEVARYVARESETLAGTAESNLGVRPSEFRLEVVQAGPVVVLRDQRTGMEFFGNGRYCGSILPSEKIEGKQAPERGG